MYVAPPFEPIVIAIISGEPLYPFNFASVEVLRAERRAMMFPATTAA
jgi:hypothetical protein